MKKLAWLILLISTSGHLLMAQLTYSEFDKITKYHNQKSYVLFGPRYDLLKNESDTFKLHSGEGEKIILEAKVAGVFDLAHSDWSKSNDIKPFQWRVAIAGNVNLRLISDPSFTSPSLPPSNKIGICTNLAWRNNSKIMRVDNYDKPIQFFRFDIFHYSNGQASSGFDSALNRINLRDGDFSTNYLRFSYGLTYSRKNPYKFAEQDSSSGFRYDSLYRIRFQRTEENRHISFLIYGQVDGRAPGALGNVFDFLPNDGNYGKYRLGGTLHVPDYISWFSNEKKGNGRLFSYNFDWELILGHLESNKVQRIGVTAKFAWHPFRIPSGIMLFSHFGRDYLNIRYTIPSPVLIVGVGIHLQSF